MTNEENSKCIEDLVAESNRLMDEMIKLILALETKDDNHN